MEKIPMSPDKIILLYVGEELKVLLFLMLQYQFEVIMEVEHKVSFHPLDKMYSEPPVIRQTFHSFAGQCRTIEYVGLQSTA